MTEKVDILGVKVDNVSFDEAVEDIDALVHDSRRHYVVTVNPEFIVAAQKDVEFKKLLNSADLAVCDGIGVLWAAKFLGSPLPQRVTGVDLMLALCGLAEAKNLTIFLLGARGDTAATAARVLRRRFGGLNILGSLSGSPQVKDDEAVVRQIKKEAGGRKIDFLFVAYGHSRQEKWIVRNLSKLEVGVAMGVGGAFDYISGEVRRAPPLMRHLGLEWLFRLLVQPSRWRRQLALLHFILLVFLQRIGLRGAR